MIRSAHPIRKFVCLFFVFACLFNVQTSQAIFYDFTQWQRARTYINPAYAGYETQLYVNSGAGNYGSNRNWIKTSAPCSFVDVEYYHRPAKTAISLGCIYKPSKPGLFDPIVSPSYHLGLSRQARLIDSTYFRFGLQVSMTHYSYSNLSPSYFPYIALNDYNVFNAAAGFLIVNKKIEFGASAASFFYTKPNFKDDTAVVNSIRFNANLNLKPITVAGNKNWKWSIGAFYSRCFTDNIIRLNTSIAYRPFNFIIGYRNPNKVIAGAGIKLQHFSIFYTRDIEDNKLTGISYFTNEVNLAIYFNQLKKEKKKS
jgi:type IX secretion system PorP/SprF family membrane protein